MGLEEIQGLLATVPLGAEIAAFLVAAFALAGAAMKLHKARSGKGGGDVPR